MSNIIDCQSQCEINIKTFSSRTTSTRSTKPDWNHVTDANIYEYAIHRLIAYALAKAQGPKSSKQQTPIHLSANRQKLKLHND